MSEEFIVSSSILKNEGSNGVINLGEDEESGKRLISSSNSSDAIAVKDRDNSICTTSVHNRRPSYDDKANIIDKGSSTVVSINNLGDKLTKQAPSRPTKKRISISHNPDRDSKFIKRGSTIANKAKSTMAARLERQKKEDLELKKRLFTGNLLENTTKNLRPEQSVMGEGSDNVGDENSLASFICRTSLGEEENKSGLPNKSKRTLLSSFFKKGKGEEGEEEGGGEDGFSENERKVAHCKALATGLIRRIKSSLDERVLELKGVKRLNSLSVEQFVEESAYRRLTLSRSKISPPEMFLSALEAERAFMEELDSAELYSFALANQKAFFFGKPKEEEEEEGCVRDYYGRSPPRDSVLELGIELKLLNPDGSYASRFCGCEKKLELMRKEMVIDAKREMEERYFIAIQSIFDVIIDYVMNSRRKADKELELLQKHKDEESNLGLKVIKYYKALKTFLKRRFGLILNDFGRFVEKKIKKSKFTSDKLSNGCGKSSKTDSECAKNTGANNIREDSVKFVGEVGLSSSKDEINIKGNVKSDEGENDGADRERAEIPFIRNDCPFLEEYELINNILAKRESEILEKFDKDANFFQHIPFSSADNNEIAKSKKQALNLDRTNEFEQKILNLVSKKEMMPNIIFKTNYNNNPVVSVSEAVQTLTRAELIIKHGLKLPDFYKNDNNYEGDNETNDINKAFAANLYSVGGKLSKTDINANKANRNNDQIDEEKDEGGDKVKDDLGVVKRRVNDINHILQDSIEKMNCISGFLILNVFGDNCDNKGDLIRIKASINDYLYDLRNKFTRIIHESEANLSDTSDKILMDGDSVNDDDVIANKTVHKDCDNVQDSDNKINIKFNNVNEENNNNKTESFNNIIVNNVQIIKDPPSSPSFSKRASSIDNDNNKKRKKYQRNFLIETKNNIHNNHKEEKKEVLLEGKDDKEIIYKNDDGDNVKQKRRISTKSLKKTEEMTNLKSKENSKNGKSLALRAGSTDNNVVTNTCVFKNDISTECDNENESKLFNKKDKNNNDNGNHNKINSLNNLQQEKYEKKGKKNENNNKNITKSCEENSVNDDKAKINLKQLEKKNVEYSSSSYSSPSTPSKTNQTKTEKNGKNIEKNNKSANISPFENYMNVATNNSVNTDLTLDSATLEVSIDKKNALMQKKKPRKSLVNDLLISGELRKYKESSVNYEMALLKLFSLLSQVSAPIGAKFNQFYSKYVLNGLKSSSDSPISSTANTGGITDVKTGDGGEFEINHDDFNLQIDLEKKSEVSVEASKAMLSLAENVEDDVIDSINDVPVPRELLSLVLSMESEVTSIEQFFLSKREGIWTPEDLLSPLLPLPSIQLVNIISNQNNLPSSSAFLSLSSPKPSLSCASRKASHQGGPNSNFCSERGYNKLNTTTSPVDPINTASSLISGFFNENNSSNSTLSIIELMRHEKVMLGPLTKRAQWLRRMANAEKEFEKNFSSTKSNSTGGENGNNNPILSQSQKLKERLTFYSTGNNVERDEKGTKALSEAYSAKISIENIMRLLHLTLRRLDVLNRIIHIRLPSIISKCDKSNKGLIAVAKDFAQFASTFNQLIRVEQEHGEEFKLDTHTFNNDLRRFYNFNNDGEGSSNGSSSSSLADIRKFVVNDALIPLTGASSIVNHTKNIEDSNDNNITEIGNIKDNGNSSLALGKFLLSSRSWINAVTQYLKLVQNKIKWNKSIAEEARSIANSTNNPRASAAINGSGNNNSDSTNNNNQNDFKIKKQHESLHLPSLSTRSKDPSTPVIDKKNVLNDIKSISTVNDINNSKSNVSSLSDIDDNINGNINKNNNIILAPIYSSKVLTNNLPSYPSPKGNVTGSIKKKSAVLFSKKDIIDKRINKFNVNKDDSTIETIDNKSRLLAYDDNINPNKNDFMVKNENKEINKNLKTENDNVKLNKKESIIENDEMTKLKGNLEIAELVKKDCYNILENKDNLNFEIENDKDSNFNNSLILNSPNKTSIELNSFRGSIEGIEAKERSLSSSLPLASSISTKMPLKSMIATKKEANRLSAYSSEMNENFKNNYVDNTIISNNSSNAFITNVSGIEGGHFNDYTDGRGSELINIQRDLNQMGDNEGNIVSNNSVDVNNISHKHSNEGVELLVKLVADVVDTLVLDNCRNNDDNAVISNKLGDILKKINHNQQQRCEKKVSNKEERLEKDDFSHKLHKEHQQKENRNQRHEQEKDPNQLIKEIGKININNKDGKVDSCGKDKNNKDTYKQVNRTNFLLKSTYSAAISTKNSSKIDKDNDATKNNVDDNSYNDIKSDKISPSSSNKEIILQICDILDYLKAHLIKNDKSILKESNNKQDKCQLNNNDRQHFISTNKSNISPQRLLLQQNFLLSPKNSIHQLQRLLRCGYGGSGNNKNRISTPLLLVNEIISTKTLLAKTTKAFNDINNMDDNSIKNKVDNNNINDILTVKSNTLSNRASPDRCHFSVNNNNVINKNNCIKIKKDNDINSKYYGKNININKNIEEKNFINDDIET